MGDHAGHADQAEKMADPLIYLPTLFHHFQILILRLNSTYNISTYSSILSTNDLLFFRHLLYFSDEKH